jgi:hypothetical protein
VRILGTDSAQGVVLLRPTHPVKNGDRVYPKSVIRVFPVGYDGVF